MAKRVLVFNGNPKTDSFSGALAQAYIEGLTRGGHAEHERKLLQLASMQFDPNLGEGYDRDHPLESDLVHFQEALAWADHAVFVAPVWWGAIPAKFKGLFDRAFLPGYAFQYEPGKQIPKKLLKGRTATIILNMDTPPWYFRLFQGAPALKQLKIATLEFSGIKVLESKMIGPIIHASDVKREAWLDQIRAMAQKAG